VLHFALLPELRDQVTEDAGPLYKKAAELLLKTPASQSERSLLYNWMQFKWGQLPLAELPRDEVRAALAVFKEPLDLLERAGRCENCDWGMTQRVRESGVAVLLPELQPLRLAMVILALKVRLELAEDRPERALQTLQVAYQMGRRLTEAPTLISALVGFAMTSIANGMLEQIMAHPKAPNLYWSLTSLPRPFAAIRKPFQGERLMVYSTFPGSQAVANDLQAGPMPEKQLQDLTKRFFGISEERSNFFTRLQLASLISMKHEAAKRALVAAGRPRARVESWPHIQVALMHALLEYDQAFDELLKLQTLPYTEIRPVLDKLDRQFKDTQGRRSDAPALPLARLMLPATSKILAARARLDRSFAALRCVEAIRLHTAGNGGIFPTSLNDIKEVPIPVCPVTGKPFEYRLQGDTALLTAPLVQSGSAPVIQPLVYELTMRR